MSAKISAISSNTWLTGMNAAVGIGAGADRQRHVGPLGGEPGCEGRSFERCSCVRRARR